MTATLEAPTRAPETAADDRWEMLGRQTIEQPLYVMARATGPLAGGLTFTAERRGVAWQIRNVDTDTRHGLVPCSMFRGDTLTVTLEMLGGRWGVVREDSG